MDFKSKFVLIKPLYRCVRCHARIEGPIIKKLRSRILDGNPGPAGSRNAIFHECNETEIGICISFGVDIMDQNDEE